MASAVLVIREARCSSLVFFFPFRIRLAFERAYCTGWFLHHADMYSECIVCLDFYRSDPFWWFWHVSAAAGCEGVGAEIEEGSEGINSPIGISCAYTM